MKITELMNEGLSADAKKWVKDNYDGAKFKGNKILLPMSEQEYNKKLLSILQNFDFHCPENMKHVGKDWGGTYEDGHMTVTLA